MMKNSEIEVPATIEQRVEAMEEAVDMICYVGRSPDYRKDRLKVIIERDQVKQLQADVAKASQQKAGD